jgi:hypothetical protein
MAKCCDQLACYGTGSVFNREASGAIGSPMPPTRPLRGPRRSPDSQRQSGYALLPSRSQRQFLIQIDAPLSPCLPRRIGRQALLWHSCAGHFQATIRPVVVVVTYSEGILSGIGAPQPSISSRKADCQFRVTMSWAQFRN